MKKRNRGFTLLELMVVIVLAAILFGVGIPSFTNFIRNARMTSAANDLIAAVHMTRAEAVKRRDVAVACSSANPMAASPACSQGTGWFVWADLNANLVADAGEPVLNQHDVLPPTMRTIPRDANGAVIPNTSWWYVAYADNGLAVPLATAGSGTALRRLIICDSRGNEPSFGGVSAARMITVTAVGRPSVSRDRAEIQAQGGCI